jgi:hypothetical protein
MDSSGAPEALFVGAIFAFYGLIILIAIGAWVLWVVELVDCARRQFADPNEKIVWILVIALTHFLGAVIYWFAGRPRGYIPGPPPA